jgi:hypothetical protein
MSLTAEFEARRNEACAAIDAVIEQYRDVFGPHAPDDDDGEQLTEEPASGMWVTNGWGLALQWLRADGDFAGDDPVEFVRAVSPRGVSYATRVGLYSCAVEAVR